MIDANVKPNDLAMSCIGCGEVKLKWLFPAGRNKCKQCRCADKRRNRQNESEESRDRRLAKARQYNSDHRPEISAFKRTYHAANKDRIRQCQAAYYQSNKAIICDRVAEWRRSNPDKRLASNRRWVAENPEKASDCNRRNKAKRMACPISSMHERVRALVAQALRGRGYRKTSRTHEILGCDLAFFKDHMERQFLKGMSWDNRNEWHIDHIVPLASAKTEEDVIRLNHFTNLRPLWAKDNIAKSDRITHLI